MNFFKSILSDDPSPQNLANHNNSDTNQAPETAENEYTNLNLNSNSSGEGSAVSGGVTGGGSGLWSFGDLVKTITTRSESVLETYTRDLKEFGSGLKKESDLFREIASRAVKELPASMEVAGATAIDGVVKSTAEINNLISQGKDVVLEALEPSDVDESGTSDSVQNNYRYSRFDSQLNMIQSDVRTYCEDPDDLEDFRKWKLGFVVSDKETERLIGENEVVGAVYKKVVEDEGVVDDERFWCRYFYKVYKLKQQEDLRANLVRRSLMVDDEQELSWDVDDDENDNENAQTVNSKIVVDDDDNENELVPKTDENDEKPSVELVPKTDENAEKPSVELVPKSNENVEKPSVELVPKADDNVEKPIVELVQKTDENSKVSLQDEEELEWDEIGDIGENDDEKNVTQRETVKNGDVIKQLNVGEDDEDLSWDIEDDDDDEPVKAGSSK